MQKKIRKLIDMMVVSQRGAERGRERLRGFDNGQTSDRQTFAILESLYLKQVKNSREGRCVTRMFRGPILVDRMMGS